MESCKAEESILLQQPKGRSTTAAATTSTGRSEPLTCRRPSVSPPRRSVATRKAVGTRQSQLFVVCSRQ
nr:hypothetical protein Itr_chr05CG13020 [Ipomoea trifida]